MIMPRRLLLLSTAIVVLAASACSAQADATPDPAADPTVAATEAPASASATDPWAVNAVEHRAAVGEEFTYDCPPADESRLDSVWGTEVYTDDSSICSAAVHAGAITLEEGGEVTIEMAPGEDAYEASEENGVESLPYGAWGGSFIVVND
jgi:hypothetical protein